MTKKRNLIQCRKKIRIRENLELSSADFFFIGGPCVIENRRMAFEIAGKLAEMTKRLGVPFVFKASYDKANRTSGKGFRGPGMKNGLEILAGIKKKYGLPVITDVHGVSEVKAAAKTADILQIPAFLCRQTDLIAAAAAAGKPINIKKGQFLSPWEMPNIIEKAERTAGSAGTMLTERGFSFGYNNLVVDLRSIAVMRKTGCPVIIDATHSVQRPGGAGDASGGDREYAETIALGALAAGASGLFMEVHNDIKNAKSDKSTQYPLEKTEKFLIKAKNVFEAANKKNAEERKKL